MRFIYVLSILLSVLLAPSYSQSISDGELSPDTIIQSNDSLHYTFFVGTNFRSLDEFVNISIIIQDELIKVTTCIADGDLPATGGIQDTLFLASNLTPGKYRIEHISKRIHVLDVRFDSLCENVTAPSDLDTVYYNFTVLGPTSTTVIENQNFTILPNPIQDHLTIEWKNTEHQPNEIFIYDLQGQLVKYEYLSDFPNAGIDVSSLDAGMYIVRIRDERRWLASERVVKLE